MWTRAASYRPLFGLVDGAAIESWIRDDTGLLSASMGALVVAPGPGEGDGGLLPGELRVMEKRLRTTREAALRGTRAMASGASEEATAAVFITCCDCATAGQCAPDTVVCQERSGSMNGRPRDLLEQYGRCPPVGAPPRCPPWAYRPEVLCARYGMDHRKLVRV